MYIGLNAKLEIKAKAASAAVVVAYISNWSVEETRDIVEVTSLGKNSKEKKPTLYSWTASADGSVDFAAANNQQLFRTAMLNGDLVDVTFYLDTAVKFTGSAYIESMSFDISAEDKGNISISLNGTGDLTLTVA